MINQISSQSPKLPFFYRHLPILLGVIIVIIIAGGILGWQYWLAPKEEKEALRDVQTTEELETERAEVLEREFPMEEAIKEEVVPAEEEFKVLPEEEILEEKIPPQIEYSKERLPRFEDFSILERFEGIPAQVDLLSHPKAMEFRTRLIEGAKKGPNFAGHYTVVTWGCGTNCTVVAIVDAKTGIVHFAPFILNVGGKFKIDSNLFIVNPPRAIDGEFPEMFHTAYYKWENNQFVLLWSTDEKTR